MPLFVSKERAVDLRQHLTEGRVPIPQTGAVVAVVQLHPPFVVVDGQDVEVVTEPWTRQCGANRHRPTPHRSAQVPFSRGR